jgi:hypothetical protein
MGIGVAMLHAALLDSRSHKDWISEYIFFVGGFHNSYDSCISILSLLLI